MLMLFSKTKDPRMMQSYLEKCFSGISKLGFDSLLNINAIYSYEEEEIIFVSKVSTSANEDTVEKWFVQVEDQMVVSVRDAISRSTVGYRNESLQYWLKSWPGQIIICVFLYYWTQNIHNCFYSKNLKMLQDYTNKIRDQIQDGMYLLQENLTSCKRRALASFITILVHCRDVCHNLWTNNICMELDFLWISQMRYYWEDDIKVKTLNAIIKYGYEYLGSPQRLVITALTERCYNILINAFHLQYGGAPEGPSGTGKTETIKDLAQAIGIQCRIFNCSLRLSVLDMTKFLKGLASSGSWACFHQLDHSNIELLSIVGQQILCIIQAKRNNLAVFTFAGSTLILNPTCYICITIDPSSNGRVSLPSNLKVLFRSVAMMFPDFHLIVQTILYSSGFAHFKTLSAKLVAVFQLCAEQLSSQTHYDYGMRSLKAVLELASNLKLRNPDESEERIIMNSLYINTLPKLIIQDARLFKEILKDIFPSTDIPSNSSDLYENILKVCEEKNLQPMNSFIEKIIYTYEVMTARHSVMIIGSTFGGKSTVIQVLSEALDYKENIKVNQCTTKIQVVNPKAVAIGHLFGYYHSQTEEWMDGIVGKVFRECANENTSDRKWIVFDGPVTAAWAENLNTAIDENKILFLNTGEVIKITDSVSIIFECFDLLQASPAVISRCGVIYVDPDSIGWISIIKSWNNTIPQKWVEDKPDRFITLLKWLIPPCLNFIKKQCHKLAGAGDIHSVSSVCQLIEIMLLEAVNGQDLKYISSWSQAVIALSVLWGTAGLIDIPSRGKFDTFFKSLWQGDNSESDCKSFSEEIEISLPAEGLLEDYIYNFKGKGNWKYWPEVLKVMKLDDIFNSRNNMVTTVESLKYTFLIELMIKYKKRFLITGPTGTGKSFIIQRLLSDSVASDFVPAFLSLTISITAEFTQELIISKLVKRTKNKYGPISGKISIMFIDDLNMPKNEDDTKPPLELLRQFFDHGYWYDLKIKEKIYVQDLFIIGAMGIKNHSSQPLSPRFLRHFFIFGISISDDSLVKIFTTTLFLGLRKNSFPADIMGTVQQIISATMYVYTSVISSLLPTPMKYHYIFNIRDLVRTFQGYLLIKKESVDAKKVFVRLWVHEILRVFCDRLVDLADKEWLIEKLKCAVEEQFKETFEVMMDGLETNGANQLSTSSFSNLIFTTALEPEVNENQKYEEVPSLEQFYNVAFKALEEFNAINKRTINITLFRFALEHLSRICRIISVPYGNGLLIGVNGSGRHSLVTLATTMLQQDLFQPTVSKHFCSLQWRKNLKNVLKYAGTENKNCTFLLHESHLEMDYVLQDVDSVLSTGEVPILYAADEIQDILEMVRLAAQGGNLSVDVSPLTVFSFYINRCKRNLHIMLCLSPVGPNLRNRMRLYPALINSCTIDWFETSWTLEVNGKKLETTGWPEDALERVARQYLEDVQVSETIKEDVVNISKYFYVTARNNADRFYLLTSRRVSITSTSFIDLLKHYNIFVKEKKDELEIAKEKYLGGLEKLEFAANQVEVMQKDLESLQPALKKAAEETLEMLKVIETETFEVEKASERVRNDEEIANEQAMSAMGLKTECENDLALAIPILEDAVAALNTLKPADITLVKSMKNPPETVKLVLAAVCVMRGIKPDRLPDPKNPGRKINDYWGPSKRLLGDMSFLQQLKDYDKDNIPPNIMKAVRTQYLNHKDFKPKVVAKASSAAEGLCKWVIALDKYDVVVKEVAPKKEKLKIAEKEYSETMAILEEKRNLLKGLEDKLAELKENLREANERKIRLQNEVVLCSNKLQKAQRIIGSLGGEKEKWALVSDILQKQYSSIPGDILISCGIIVYLAPLTSLFRKDIVSDWIIFCTDMGIPLSESYSLVNALGSNVLIENWNINGLPSDTFSLENAIILHASQKWPLLIDPHNQANRWIRNMEKENELIIIKFSEDNVEIILKCVQSGKPILLENIPEQLDWILNPILEKEIFKQNNKQFLKLRDSTINHNLNFRFYMTTKLRNPNYSPEVYKKFTVINFTITKESLSDKLLSIVVSKERPEMQLKRKNLMKESAKNKQDLHGVEDSILQTLSSVRGNILEDENAVNILDSSKTVADQLKKRENSAKETSVNIEKTWLRYKPIADHVAALYYTITNLAAIDPMYQYSVNWFIKIFIHSINTAAKNSSIEERIKNLKQMFNYNLYVNVTYTLFDKDRILYSFLLCTKLLLLENKILEYEFDYLLGKRNPEILENCCQAVENKLQLPQKSWENLCYLNTLSSFRGLVDSIHEEPDLWLKFCTRYNSSCEELPLPWEKNLNYFQKLILLHTLRPDQIPVSILEIGVKIIIEGPIGLKNNLLERYYSQPVCDHIFYESCPEKEKIFTRLLYGITFFHSVVRERGTFGPIGWTFPYNFDECDYVTTILQLQKFLSDYEETPFKVIKYLIGECNYGGKLQDDWDMKILKSILKRFINKDIIFCQDYSLHENEKCYSLPVRYDYKDFIQCIKSLPATPNPEVYGLNKNAGVMRNLNISNKLLDAFLGIFGENLPNKLKTSDDYVHNIAEDILLKMPGSFDTDIILNQFSTCNNECMVSVLFQEILAFNYLQDVINSSLKDLLNAIKGLTVLTPDLEDILASLASSLVPKVWRKYSYSSLKPLGSYINDLIERVRLLQKWFSLGHLKDFWISGFYFPHSFMSAIKQDFARKNKISVLELGFDYEVLTIKRAENYPDVGAFVYGIYLIGARWDEMKQCLEEELPMVMYEELPLLWVKPCFKNKLKVENKYTCPLYRTTERKGKITSAGLSTNYILPILLDTHLDPSHWVTRGVALVCQLDE
nr:dynein heavy chain 7, axonemal-like [Halyomorpha halys]